MPDRKNLHSEPRIHIPEFTHDACLEFATRIVLEVGYDHGKRRWISLRQAGSSFLRPPYAESHPMRRQERDSNDRDYRRGAPNDPITHA